MINNRLEGKSKRDDDVRKIISWMWLSIYSGI